MTPCRLVNNYRHFKEAACQYTQGLCSATSFRAKKCSSCPARRDSSQKHIYPFNEYRGFFSFEQSGRGIKLIAHHYLAPGLSLNGTINLITNEFLNINCSKNIINDSTHHSVFVAGRFAKLTVHVVVRTRVCNILMNTTYRHRLPCASCS